MAKVMKSYRMEQFTLNRLSWLAHELDLTESSVVQLAITELYMRHYYDLNNDQFGWIPCQLCALRGVECKGDPDGGAMCPNFKDKG